MRTGKTLYNGEAQSINRSCVEFANKTANIKYKKTYQFTIPCKGV